MLMSILLYQSEAREAWLRVRAKRFFTNASLLIILFATENFDT